MAGITGADQPGTDGWWLQRLGRQLREGKDRFDKLAAYMEDGGPPVTNRAAMRAAYREFLRQSQLNLAEMCVDAVLHRMQVAGFRTGADGDTNGDAEARRIWDTNDMDVRSADLHGHMIGLSRGYAIVGQREDGTALITEQDPRQVFAYEDPATRETRAAINVYRDEAEGLDMAWLYLPGRVMVATRPVRGQRPVLAAEGFKATQWEWEPELSGDLPDGMENVVPVIGFHNRRNKGEFEPHLPHLNRVNTQILQGLVVQVMQAFRQRAVKGDLPDKDEAGREIDYDELFLPGPDAMWRLPEGIDMWESAQVDLNPILTAVEKDILHFAGVTFTPMHYLFPDAAGGSAEGAALAREGLVFKTKDRMNRAAIGWKRVMSLAFLVEGDQTRASLKAMEPIWTPPERLTLAERADAASKAAPAGVPWRTIMEEVWQFDPEVIDRAESERAADAFLQAAATAAATAQVPAATPQLGQPPQGQQGRQPGRSTQDQTPAAAGAGGQ